MRCCCASERTRGEERGRCTLFFYVFLSAIDDTSADDDDDDVSDPNQPDAAGSAHRRGAVLFRRRRRAAPSPGPRGPGPDRRSDPGPLRQARRAGPLRVPVGWRGEKVSIFFATSTSKKKEMKKLTLFFLLLLHHHQKPEKAPRGQVRRPRCRLERDPALRLQSPGWLGGDARLDRRPRRHRDRPALRGRRRPAVGGRRAGAAVHRRWVQRRRADRGKLFFRVVFPNSLERAREKHKTHSFFPKIKIIIKLQEIGPPEKIVAGFAPELFGAPLQEGDTLETDVDKKGELTYYTYVLKPPAGGPGGNVGGRRLVAATAYKNRLFLLAASANPRQWRRAESELRAIVKSFNVATA